MSRAGRGRLVLGLGGLAALAWAPELSAAGSDLAAFELIHEQFGEALGRWETRILPYAQRLFVGLATIELTWTLYEGLFQRELGLEEGLGQFFWKAIRLLFFFHLLTLAPGIGLERGAEVVIDSFAVIGQSASGHSGLHPVDLLVKAFQILVAYALAIESFVTLPGLSELLLGKFLVGTLFLLGASLAWIAISVALVTLEAIVTVSIGFFLLAFAGSRFTVGIAQPYPAALVRAGIKILVTYAMAGILVEMIDIWWLLVFNPANWGLTMFLSMSFGTALMAWLVFRIPRYVADLVPAGEAVNLRMLVE